MNTIEVIPAVCGPETELFFAGVSLMNSIGKTERNAAKGTIRSLEDSAHA